MLHPEDFRVPGTLNEAMHILTVRIALQFRRSIFGTHSATGCRPGFSRISRDPDAASGNTDADVTRVAWIHANGMNARPLRSVRTPLFAFRMIPERTIQFPRFAVIVRGK